jgi:hypothetical protein
MTRLKARRSDTVTTRDRSRPVSPSTDCDVAIGGALALPDVEPERLRDPTSDELDQIATAAKWMLRRIEDEVAPPVVCGRIDADGKIAFGPTHSNYAGFKAQLCHALGSTSPPFCFRVLYELASGPGVAPGSEELAVNRGLQFIAASKPESELQTMLLLQAWHTHGAVLVQQGRTARASALPQFEANGLLGVKLAKLFIQQIEALTKLRTAGKQIIEVQHVHVYPGGQAVVGTVNTRGGSVENLSRPQTPVVPGLAFEPGVQVWSEDPGRETMRQPRGEGSTALPAARVREGRGRSGGGDERSVPNGRAHEGDGRGAAGSPEPDGGNEGAAGNRVGEDAADPSEG